MAEPLRVVQVNLAYDQALRTPEALLAAYHTLTGWANAVRGAGADVVTVQRFSHDANVALDGGRVTFIADPGSGLPGAWDPCPRMAEGVAALEPAVVHVNGLMFPGVTQALRRHLSRDTAIVLQDHSGIVPRSWPWPIDRLMNGRWDQAFADADACVFTDRALAERWHSVGLPRNTTILDIPPAGSTVAPMSVPDAVRETGMHGSPRILWVGRLDENKDPLTVLDALAIAFPRLPDARAWMVHGEAALKSRVERRIAESPILRDRITLVGSIPHDRIAAWFSAADIFVSGSHHEGSGYSLIEAMSCGVMPCVTSIPSFRALTEGHGMLWSPGDAAACANAIVQLAARDREAERQIVLQRYAQALSWASIGARTVQAYGDLAARRRGAATR